MDALETAPEGVRLALAFLRQRNIGEAGVLTG
jgi:hypothetical protein